jgi:hypothetical protein
MTAILLSINNYLLYLLIYSLNLYLLIYSLTQYYVLIIFYLITEFSYLRNKYFNLYLYSDIKYHSIFYKKYQTFDDIKKKIQIIPYKI